MIKLNLDSVKNLNLSNERLIENLFITIEKELSFQEKMPNNFVGWRSWPKNYDKQELVAMKKIAKQWNKEMARAKKRTYLVVIGIGGSYLGSKAALDFIQGLYPNRNCEFMFLGNTMSSDYVAQCLKKLENSDFYVNVISKSGTTLEPSIGFHLVLELLINKYGEEGASKRIVSTTDAKKGVLVDISKQLDVPTFVIPDNIGGRYSVLTPVGVFPMLVAGIDVDLIFRGAQQAMLDFKKPSINNPAYLYAYTRNILAKQGKRVETFVSFEMQMNFYNEFLKQLFGESEGKDRLGIWPTSCIYSTDLHSLGQPMQEGPDFLFETFIKVKNARHQVMITKTKDDLDGLNYLDGKNLHSINYAAYTGTMAAHSNDGQKSIIEIEVECMDEYNFGYLSQFFFNACAISCLMHGVNPFDQNGVEVYKKNMFKLLGKK